MDTNSFSSLISHIEQNVERVQSEVNELYKTVYKGNGSPSLVSQTVKLEEKIAHVEANLNHKLDNITAIVNEKFSNLSNQISYEFEHKKMKVEGSWKIKVAIISSIFALAASVLPTVINFFILHK